MSKELEPNADKAVGYLLWVNPEAPLYLERMESAGPQNPKAKTYQSHLAEAANGSSR